MSQERLNKLAILSIEQDLLENIEHKSSISNFAAQTVCRDIFRFFFYFFYFLYKASFFWTAPGLIILRAGPEWNPTSKTIP